MIEKLTEMVARWCERRGRVLKITGTGNDHDIYLIRYYVVRSRFCNLFIHRFLRSDRDDFHDHPWSFVTYLVRGAYTEWKWDERAHSEIRTDRKNYQYKYFGAGHHKLNRLVFRRAEDQHKVCVEQALLEKDRALAPLTICVTGPVRREWGFWVNRYEELKRATPETKDSITVTLPLGGKHELARADVVRLYRDLGRQFVPWRQYLGLPPEAPGRG